MGSLFQRVWLDCSPTTWSIHVPETGVILRAGGAWRDTAGIYLGLCGYVLPVVDIERVEVSAVSR